MSACTRVLAVSMFCILVLAPCAVAAGTDDFRTQTPTAYEELLDFMAQLAFAIFAVRGFFLSKGLSRARRTRCAQFSILVLLVLTASTSLFFVYLARLRAIATLGSGLFEYEDISFYLSVAAWSILLSGILTFLFVATTMTTLTQNERRQ